MELELTLADEMLAELHDAARECQCSPRQFAIDCVESVLASRRLPHVYVPKLSQGARMRGVTAPARHEDESESSTAALSPLDIPTADDLEELEVR